jgi:hypothetical protein
MGGDDKEFLNYMTPIVEEMSVGGGGIVGVGVPADKPEDVVVTPRAAEAHKKRVKKGAKMAGRKLFEDLLLEAKRVVQTTGHMTHVGDFLYHGDPMAAIKHVVSTHRRFHRGKFAKNHVLMNKADGGMSAVAKRDEHGVTSVLYKTGANEYTTEEQIAATGKPHLVATLTPFLRMARTMNLKPGTAVQGDILFTGGDHGGHVQPNAIKYVVPKEATIGFAPHSMYKARKGSLDLIKTSSGASGLRAEGAFIPNLSITNKTKLRLTPERHKIITDAVAQSKKILSNRKLMSFARSIPQDKKFHRMLQEYSNEAARSSGVRTVKGLTEFIPVHMGKASQRGLSDKTKKAMVDAFTRTIQRNARHLEGLFTAHGHINAAKHAIVDQFGEHADQLELKTHGGEEHEGLVSVLRNRLGGETQAKFVREGPGGFPEKNVKNAIIRFGKPPEA